MMVMAVIGTGQTWAQDAAAVSKTRIGVINLATVYEKSQRYQALKTRARQEASSHARQLSELEEISEAWKLALSKEDLSDETREMGYRTLINASRGMCGLNGENAKRLREIRQEISEIDDEVDQAISAFAVAHGFDLILSSNEPEDICERLRPRRRPVLSGIFSADAIAPGTRDVTENFLKHGSGGTKENGERP
jgi:Skp family chaperone for outer membrane proteins